MSFAQSCINIIRTAQYLGHSNLLLSYLIAFYGKVKNTQPSNLQIYLHGSPTHSPPWLCQGLLGDIQIGSCTVYLLL